MLQRLEVQDFKSYKGHQVIGPFVPFTCVIGPNGSGKSNLFDAISFVLGVRSAHLRSTQLKDLIYRGGRKRRRAGGDGDMMDVDDDEEEAEEDEDDNEAGPSARKAWVMAVYEDAAEKEWRYQRIITAAGSSEYRINGRTVPYAKYNESLEQHNILVKARNFLVFQGDVEMVASQDSKDLSRLIEQISGSLELKEEYDAAKLAQDKAVENSTLNFNRRRGINSEIKQFKEQKEEVKRFEKLQADKDEAVILHAVWKLYHSEKGIASKRHLIKEKNESVRGLRDEQATHEAKLKVARKDQVKAQKDVSKHEKLVKAKQKELDDKRPELVAIETQIAHTSKKVKTIQGKETAVQRDRAERASSLASLQKNLAETEKAVKRLEDEQRKSSKAKGLALDAKDLEEYRKLKAQASSKAVEERQTVEAKSRDARNLRDTIAGLDDKLETMRYRQSKLATEESDFSQRVKTYEGKNGKLDADLANAKKELNAAQVERTRYTQMQAELDEKLRDVVTKLLQINADQRESEREVRMKETLAVLKRTIAGVYGRVSELCKPTQRKYDAAVATVLGRNIDAVIVDTEQTAMQCIQSMRDQRSGTATFIPLNTVLFKPIDDKYRSYHRARMAIDVISFDASLERAMHYVCGNAIVCDDLETARNICYDRKQEVKAVTLDGTVIHKSGQMTGGSSSGSSSGRKWDDQEAEGLKKHEEMLRGKLADLVKTRPRGNQDERLLSDITRIETELTLVKDDLSASKTRLKSCGDELKHLGKEIDKLVKQRDAASTKLEAIEAEIATARAVIDDEEADIFGDFCERIGVNSIRDYEDKQLRYAEEEGQAKLKTDKTLARLRHQTAFETEQLQGFDDQLTALTKNIATNRDALQQLEQDKETLEADLGELEQGVADLAEQQTALEEALETASTEAERVRKASSKSSSAFQKALKEISTWNDEIEKLGAERFALYRRCRLEEIELPLLSGSLDNVPLEEPGNDTMDVDNEDSTQQPAAVKEYDLEIDFEVLDEEDRGNDSDDRDVELAEAVRKLTADLARMAPNMKSIDKLGEVEAKLKSTDKDHDAARRETKEAKERFEEVRKERVNLFNTAFNHISERIDQVYKELTKGKAAPMGGVAYLSLEDSEEPYLHGVKYHAMPPMKRFRDMEQLSGGEKTMAALALLFAIHSFKPSPFFVLDEVDAALDNTNVGRIATYIRSKSSEKFQFVVISLKGAFYEKANGLVGIWRDIDRNSSSTLTLDLDKFGLEA